MFQIFGMDKTPILDVSIVNILAMTFFVIFYTRGKINKKNGTISAVVVILYLLCVGTVSYTHLKNTNKIKS